LGSIPKVVLVREYKGLQLKRVLPIAVKALFLGIDAENSSGNRDFKGEHVVSPESLLPFALYSRSTKFYIEPTQIPLSVTD